MLSVCTRQQGAVLGAAREFLGSASSCRISAAALGEWEAKRSARRRQKEIETERAVILERLRKHERMHAARHTAMGAQPPSPSTARLCDRCNCCPGFRRPLLHVLGGRDDTIELREFCAECGCREMHHCQTQRL